MKSGALYIRVSTDKQEELSPDAQKRLLLDYAQKNDIVISEDYIFLENGISGKKADKRPQFQKMIGFAKSKEHPIDVILVWKYSRFARNQEESIVYKSLLGKNNVDVVSVSEPLIEGPFGSLIERIIEWMDEYYSIRLSGEVIRGMTENALKGGYNAAPPLGYDAVKNGVPVINEDQAAVVRYIFDQYVNKQQKLVDIARLLNDRDISTKRGSRFEMRTIKYIINNPFYIGKIRWNRQHHESHTIRSEEEWIIRDGQHQPIISTELFEQANDRCKRECKKLDHRRAQSSCKHWLSGTLKCSECGRSLVHSISRRGNYEYLYFQCYAYLKGLCEKSHFIPEAKITSSVIDGLKKVLLSDQIDYELIPNKAENDVNTEVLLKRLDKLLFKEARIKAAYIDGIDTLEEYKKNKSLLQTEKISIEDAISSKEVKPVKTQATDQLMINKIADLIRVLESSADYTVKGNALRDTCEKIVYDKEIDTLQFYFYYVI